MATPLGPRLLGVSEAPIQRRQLGELLGSMQRYNRHQAVVASLGSGAQDPPAAGGDSGAAGSDGEEAAAAEEAAARERRAAAALDYSRQLAAAALVLGVGVKHTVETPAVRGASLGRLMARAFAQQSRAAEGALKAGRLEVRWRVWAEWQHGAAGSA